MLKKIKKGEKGSITILVLTTMLVVVGVITFAYTSVMNKNSSQEREIDRIQEEYNQTSSIDQIYEETLTGQYFTTTKTIDGKSVGTYLNPTIPAGFKPVDTDKAKWGTGSSAPTQTDVNEGLVIEDKEGNQFVWIPVETVVATNNAEANSKKAMAIKSGENYIGLLYDFNYNTIKTYYEPKVVSYYNR